MKIKNAVILAAGKSSRFGKNKLLENMPGLYKTLPQNALDFCIQNEIENVYITISKDCDMDIEGNRIIHPIIKSLERYEPFLNIEFAFQDETKYGPGAALLPWQFKIHDHFITLFGDNYYEGELDLGSFGKGTDCIVTYKTLEPNYKNMRFAAIQKGIVIEKPHSFVDGQFFCGYCVFNGLKLSDHLEEIEISGRNEYEITDLINSFEDKAFKELKINWEELTYVGDENKIEEIINAQKR